MNTTHLLIDVAQQHLLYGLFSHWKLKEIH